MTAYSASTQDYINRLSQRLPFPFRLRKIVDSFNSCEYLELSTNSTTFTFPYDRSFYQLIFHIVDTIQSKHPELFI